MPPRLLTIPKTNSGPRPLTTNQNSNQNSSDLVLTDIGPLKSVSGASQITTANQTASKQVEKQFEQQESNTVQSVINDLVMAGTPLKSITAEQLFGNENVKKVGIDNIGKIKNILDTYKQDKQDKVVNALQGSIEELIFLSDKIPTGSGFSGRYLTAGSNVVKQNTGYLPQKDVFDATVKSTLSSIARSFGEVGNLSEFDQKNYESLLGMLGSPQIEVRKEARASLARRLSKGLGMEFNLSSPFEINKKMNQKASTPSLENKLTPEQEKRAQELLKML